MPFKPSKYQQEIYNWIENGEGSAIINAVAGSGKTTTIVNAVKLLPKNLDVAFFAFNSGIAKEISQKVPKGTTTKTIHSYGYACWKKHMSNLSIANNTAFDQKVKPDQYKLKRLINENLTKDAKALFGNELDDLICKARADGLAPDLVGITPIISDTFENWQNLIRKYGIEIKKENQKLAIEYASNILRLTFDNPWPVDFDEMLYLPAISDIQTFKQFDWVFVDEAQDLSGVQRSLIQKTMHSNTRLVAVGDPHQAIYGFRGASSDSMDLIKSHFNCNELNLSICYRCATSIIKLAKTIVPYIEGSENAKEGEVITRCKTIHLDSLKDNSMIICRNNAPLVKVAFELLKHNHPLNVQFGNFDNELISSIKLLSDGLSSTAELLNDLAKLNEKAVSEALELNIPQIIEKIQDRFDSLKNVVIATNSTSKPELVTAIKDLVKNTSGVTICSIHKSKGLEKDNTYIVDIDLIPSKYATLDWQKTQENNLLYVAYTRAKNKLAMIDSKAINFVKTSSSEPLVNSIANTSQGNYPFEPILSTKPRHQSTGGKTSKPIQNPKGILTLITSLFRSNT